MILSWFALTLAGLVALGWSLLAIRLIRLTRGPWFRFLNASPPEAVLRHLPSVAAIVPARNEEEHVAATVAALRQQDYPGLVITVVDDESTDATGVILHRLAAEDTAGRAPLQVVDGTTRPNGWVGKTWAVHQAAAVADADWLWFVDADMGLDPRALTTALAEAERTGADFVSFLPGVRCETFWQRTIAMSFLHILAHLFPLHHVNDPTRAEAIAAGGFVLVRRSTYQAVGGHESIRQAINEDIELARAVKRNGGRLAIRLAPGLAWTHMYGSFGAIWTGLRKNAYAGMDFMPHKFVVGAIVALTMAWAPWVAVGVGIVDRWPLLAGVGSWGIAAQVAATIPNLIFVGASPFYALALPLGISAYVAIASASVWHFHRGRVFWKGRTIAAASLTGFPRQDVVPEQHEPNRGQNVAKRR